MMSAANEKAKAAAELVERAEDIDETTKRGGWYEIPADDAAQFSALLKRVVVMLVGADE